MLTEFSRRLLHWYQINARQLPWRVPPTNILGENSEKTILKPDPYKVWVSEVMLQQTRVETILPYYQNWLEHFPTLQALAKASEQEVLFVWEGLGYYHRARNFHKAAQQVVNQLDGQIPSKRKDLEKLPGIGQYTAGAISSIAFYEDEPALDGNIRRVLARFFNLELPIQTTDGEKELEILAATNLPPGKAGDYNQALMDLGASICTPRNPSCLLCPLSDICQSRLLGNQKERPIIPSRPPIPHFIVTAGIIERDGALLIAKRPSKGLLGGLWEFPGGKQEEGEELPACLQRELREELSVEIEVGPEFGVYRHAYTHFRVTLHAFHCRLCSGEPLPLEASELRWVKSSELKTFPMGKIDRLISIQLESQTSTNKSVEINQQRFTTP